LHLDGGGGGHGDDDDDDEGYDDDLVGWWKGASAREDADETGAAAVQVGHDLFDPDPVQIRDRGHVRVL